MSEPQHLDEYEDFKRGERVAAASLMGGRELAEATIDAFLASPQAAEELARAMKFIPPIPDEFLLHKKWVESDWLPNARDYSFAILTAWQELRHPEDG